MELNGKALRYASKVSDYAIVELLLKASKSKQKLKRIINTKDERARTALQYACQKKCTRTLKLLLQNEAGKV